MSDTHDNEAKKQFDQRAIKFNSQELFLKDKTLFILMLHVFTLPHFMTFSRSEFIM